MIPYVDSGTFSRAPTGLDLNQLLVGGTQADQAAELTNVLLRASRWIDIITQQRWGLAASTNQDPPVQVTARKDGTILYSPLTFPVVAVTAGNWWTVWPGAAPVVNAINTSLVTVLDKKILIADTWAYRWSRTWGAQPLMVQLSYENGYAHTTLTEAATAGSNTITVGTTIGIGSFSTITAANQTPYLSILDGNQREDIVVTSITGSTLTLESNLTYAHTAGVIVTGLPYDIQQSTIDLAAYLIKTRDAGSLEMTEQGFGQQQPAKGLAAGQGLDETFKRLIPYTRVGGA